MQEINNIIKIISHSPLYEGHYITKILNRGEKAWIINMPVEKGRFIPLPVGTILEVKFLHEEGFSFHCEVIGRSFRGGRTLTITAPNAISRGGRPHKSKAPGRVIAFSSGKGGVGKSTLLINTALALQSLGKRICIIDADLGTADIDTLLKINAPYNLYHLIQGEKKMEQIIVRGPKGILLVPGGSGLDELANLREWQFSLLISAFNKLENVADCLFIDTGAGVSRNVTNFLMAVDDIVLVTTSEPHAVMDAYALIKVLANYKIKSNIKLIVNMTEKEEDARHVWETINSATKLFLNLPLEYLGNIPSSRVISRSVQKQKPFFLEKENDRSAKRILAIARTLLADTLTEGVVEGSGKTGFLTFLHRLREIMLSKT